MYQSEDTSNLPENTSEAAKKIYTILANSEAPKGLHDLIAAYASWAPGMERYKAIATANGLVVKGIVKVEKEDSSNEFYVLAKSTDEVSPSDDADANEEYAQKTEANDEEKRMIAILEQHGKRLSADELFNLYLAEETPDGTVPTPEEDVHAAIKELTDAGTITAEGDSYHVKK